MLTGLPNGNKLVTRPSSAVQGAEMHVQVQEIDVHALVASGSDPRVWSAPCGNAAGNCTFLQDYDYDQGPVYQTPAAPDAPTCCNLCVAAGATTCYAASFAGGVCYFKPDAGKKLANNNGVISVFPPGSVIPPLPPRTIETHGYYQVRACICMCVYVCVVFGCCLLVHETVLLAHLLTIASFLFPRLSTAARRRLPGRERREQAVRVHHGHPPRSRVQQRTARHW